ncbi:hypothetical protein [Desulfofalx alkaliphila]|uniref:hypothetical protein n=1 Tax=Desulfofalx alkaliphila TaxID=105483 RepID=UPI0004E1D126|nr:hypothetical protein [Desulfofalx alkaliphila]
MRMNVPTVDARLRKQPSFTAKPVVKVRRVKADFTGQVAGWLASDDTLIAKIFAYSILFAAMATMLVKIFAFLCWQ